MLQKTMVVVEGVARKLDPHLDMWATAEPVVGGWIAENLGPRGRIEDLGRTVSQFVKLAADAPPRLERLSRPIEREAETAPAEPPSAPAGGRRPATVGPALGSSRRSRHELPAAALSRRLAAEEASARFVVEVVESVDLRAMAGSYRGSGSASYHPSVLLGLLIYGYATGVFASRKLERATYDLVAFASSPPTSIPITTRSPPFASGS